MVKDKYVHNHITIFQIYTIPGSGWHFARSMDKQTYPWKCKPWINNNRNLQEKNAFELTSTRTFRYLYSELAEQSLSHYQMQTSTLPTWQLIILSSSPKLSLLTFAKISRGTVCCGLPTSCLPQPSIHKNSQILHQTCFSIYEMHTSANWNPEADDMECTFETQLTNSNII